MPSLAALLLATPIFGFSLTLPPSAPFLAPGASAAHLASLPLPLVLEAGDVAEAVAVSGDEGAPPETRSEDDAAAARAEMSDEDRRFLEETTLRRDLGAVHRVLGISTWISMTAAVVFGFIQYYDLYGVQAPMAEAPCTTGTAVFQDQCWGAPWPHRISVITTSALYVATFSLSLAMPDPNHVSEGTGAFAERIRAHQILRWIHLAGMVAQTVIGLGVANGWFGDRANDYETLQIIAGVHQAIGWTTWFAVGLAGAIMIF